MTATGQYGDECVTTIIEVAKAAGVSTATVSRVLSHPDRVLPSTRNRVLEIVKSLGYRPNAAARTLRTLRSAKILVTVPDIANPFFASVIHGAEEAARERGYGVVLGNTRHDPAIEDMYAAMLSRHEVDGLIFLGHHLPEVLRRRVRDGVAAVVNGCDYSPDLGVPSVHIDNAAAAMQGMEHLFALGHRDIGIVTGPEASPISRDRLHGAVVAADRVGSRERLRTRIGDYGAQSAFFQAGELIRAGVSAIFCFSDVMAMGAIRAVHEAGLRCPADISVLGFDDLPLAAFFQPALTTIVQPKELIGQRAVELLIGLLTGDALPTDQVTLKHELIIRSSTGPAASTVIVQGRTPGGG